MLDNASFPFSVHMVKHHPRSEVARLVRRIEILEKEIERKEQWLRELMAGSPEISIVLRGTQR
jgi:hypothetical protein